MSTALAALKDFVASHGMHNVRIEADAVVFEVECWHAPTNTTSYETETVRTVREARDALGY
jgi:hypothetical protein